MGKKKDKSLDDILARSVAEKILVVEKIWDDIKESTNTETPTDKEVQLVKKRIASYKENPSKVKAWEDVKTNYLKKK